MKLVVAIIQPKRLDQLASALRRAGIAGITVTQAKGFGREHFDSDWDFSGDLSNKTRVEMVVSDEACENIVDIIQKTVSTRRAGDGLIYVQPVEMTMRISTGDKNT